MPTDLEVEIVRDDEFISAAVPVVTSGTEAVPQDPQVETEDPNQGQPTAGQLNQRMKAALQGGMAHLRALVEVIRQNRTLAAIAKRRSNFDAESKYASLADEANAKFDSAARELDQLHQCRCDAVNSKNLAEAVPGIVAVVRKMAKDARDMVNQWRTKKQRAELSFAFVKVQAGADQLSSWLAEWRSLSRDFGSSSLGSVFYNVSATAYDLKEAAAKLVASGELADAQKTDAQAVALLTDANDLLGAAANLVSEAVDTCDRVCDDAGLLVK